MAPPPPAINLEDKFRAVQGRWSPHILARLNDFHVKAVRAHGAFVWHRHAATEPAGTVNTGDAGGALTASEEPWI